MKAYLANGLFSEADRMYNSYLAEQIRKALPDVDLYVPQENHALNDKSGYAESVAIFNGDNQHLDNANILFAVIDGSEIDAGVAAEIGRFTSQRDYQIAESGIPSKVIYALYSDVRQEGRDNTRKIDALVKDGSENQFMYKNLYVIGAIKRHGYLFRSTESLVDFLNETVAPHGKDVFSG